MKNKKWKIKIYIPVEENPKWPEKNPTEKNEEILKPK